jgi:hypothetical protein
MTATPAEANLAELARRAAETLAADAAEHGIDLSNPVAREGFKTGVVVSLGWITAAHETGKISDAAYRTLEGLFSTAITGLEAR